MGAKRRAAGTCLMGRSTIGAFQGAGHRCGQGSVLIEAVMQVRWRMKMPHSRRLRGMVRLNSCAETEYAASASRRVVEPL